MRTRALRSAAAIGMAVICTVSTAATTVAATGQQRTPIYLDRSYAPRERAADLVSRMTLQEKASQTNSSRAPAVPRLGVRAYGWWNEAAHGVAREQKADGANPEVLTNTTSYPVDLSMGSTWDRALMHRVATQISDETREVVRGNGLDLNVYSPTVNLGRDPRWGRNDETFSEDPTLTTAMASQYVNGMEGKDRRGNLLPSARGYLKTSTTLKHFAANNSEFNRTTGSSNVDERTLRDYYTKQFRDIVRRSHPSSIMSSYNSVNGVPAAASTHLMDTLARKTFGFRGFLTSDCDAVYEIQHGHHWQPPSYDHPLGGVERNAYANAAGEDLDCNQGLHDRYNYANTLPTAVRDRVRTANGVYTENALDTSLVRLFATRIQLGEFDREADVPWVTQARARVAKGSWTNSDANRAVTETPKRLALARHAADESIVLLKNAASHRGDRTDKLLPLRVPESGPYRLAVIGNHAKPDHMYLGGYSSNQGNAGQANNVDGYQGIEKAVRRINPDAVVDYLPGTEPGTDDALNRETVARSANYDAAVVYAGTDADTAEEERDRTSLALPAPQTSLIKQVAARNPNTAVYLETIGEVNVSSFGPDVSAILWSSYNGQRKGQALADVLLGRSNPSGHLPFTWYRDVSQLRPIGDYAVRPSESRPGRTYMYFDGPVSYPFGHGLSYSRFAYSHLRVDRRHVDPGGTLHITAEATNTGNRTGADVAQLYVSTPEAGSSGGPAKRLVGFRRVTLRPHQTKQVRFAVRVPDLAHFDASAGHDVVDNGTYRFELGRSSSDPGNLRASAAVYGSLRPKPSTVTATPLAAGDAARGVTSRVFFAPGTRVTSRVSVAMSDDTLYGYRADGPSTPLPPGMRVRYRSNRPDVVAVRQGTVRARHQGVATITVTVTYRGARSSTSFVVDVR